MRSSTFRSLLVASLLAANACASSSPSAAAIDPLDWPSWRGPEQNGISRETGLPEKWSPDGENLLWKSPELATRSTPIVMRGKLYTLARSNPGTPVEGEKVICADAATGKILWENKFNVFLSDVPDTRVAWSCCVGDPTTGRVYAMGVCDYFQCIDGDSGKTIWSHSLSEEFGFLSTYGGRTNVPIIFEDLVIISAVTIGWGDLAKPAHRFLAFQKETGELVWMNGTRLLPDDTTYSTPTVGMLGGQMAMVFGSGDGGLYAMQPRTGAILWKCDLSIRGMNVSPVIDGNTVYMGQSEENPDDTSMGALAAVDGTGSGDVTKSKMLWRVKERLVGKSSPLVIGGRFYAVDDGGTLFILDTKTGTEVGRTKLGTIMRASLTYADGKIYAAESNGRWTTLKPTEKGVEVVQRLRLPGETHGSPIVSHGRLYVPTTEAMFCIGKKDAAPAASPRPQAAAEPDVASDKVPKQLQIVPAELILAPGQKASFHARLFNARGQLVGDVKPEWSVTGSAAIDAQGALTAAPKSGHGAAIVTAKANDLTATARCRVVPPLPWRFDFSDGEVPIPWVGARYRHVIRKVDGNDMMVKITTIPKGTRSQAWMGPIGLHDYTMQADVRGALKDAKVPDIGLIAQRYTFDMMGASQQLQIRTWPPTLRMAKTIPFTWKPEVWYTMKFRAAVEGPKAVLRGKVWERGQAEPSDWMITAEDESPNLTGSPGLFGNASNAEIFIDNISVLPNETPN